MPITITLKGREVYDEETNRFYEVPETKLVLEHSLVALTEWEKKWKTPWFSKNDKTAEQWFDYLKFMIIEPKEFDDDILKGLTKEDITAIKDYIMDPMTATTITDRRVSNGSKGRSAETLTSELIYYYMFSLRIPKECEKWHLNNLLMLLRVFSVKDSSDKQKMSRNEILRSNAAINAANRKRFNTKG